ncbi:hypothetical protein JANAI62_19870 [Jannaschia pagri]|uniref:DUF3291 domain-containing protein n=1 Tax=Jannaschia pagri TaxID=2829797 RepID=A0ABQ4NLT0_9RHOB|nr:MULTISPECIES: DUF3291 domain-containing protein [unclassified Jannaschia]GIT91530.1 hypothetical protein JANAI61_19880 [Jannaschia sp. AI_61]GIT95364.1 hypothetical protein JANAI62_19870 [Jannaschia sp. AI_62]
MIAPPAPDWQLAEVNIARLKAPIDSPIVAEFAGALDRINGLAERMDGFVWRHIDEGGNATQTQPTEDPRVIYNASVWRDGPALETFVWGTLHARFYERRAEWFDALGSMHFAMWWVPPGHRPDPAEAMERLAALERDGPGAQAFGWADLPGATRWRTARCVPA